MPGDSGDGERTATIESESWLDLGQINKSHLWEVGWTLEVKGDFCHDMRRNLAEAKREPGITVQLQGLQSIVPIWDYTPTRYASHCPSYAKSLL